MGALKTWFKQNSHSAFFRTMSRFGLSMNRLYENSNHNPHSNGEFRILELMAADLSVAVDVGANVGMYTTELHRIVPDCRIFSVEPGKEAFAELSRRTEGINKIVSLNTGLYSHESVKSISSYASTTHFTLYGSELVHQEEAGEEEIQLQTGDHLFGDVLGLDSIDLLKLDTEGAEYDILQGFEHMISNGKVKAIQFEYGSLNVMSRKLLIDFYELLEPMGYVIGKVYPKSVDFKEYTLKQETFIDGNYLAVLKGEKALIERLS